MIYALDDSGDIIAYSHDIEPLKRYADDNCDLPITWYKKGSRDIGAIDRFKFAFEIYPIMLLEDMT